MTVKKVRCFIICTSEEESASALNDMVFSSLSILGFQDSVFMVTVRINPGHACGSFRRSHEGKEVMFDPSSPA